MIMNVRVFALLTLSIVIAACDRGGPTERTAADQRREEQRIADEQYLAELREVERRAADREAALRKAETDIERRKIAEERAVLEREKQRLLAEQRRVEEKRRSADKAAADDAARNASKQARAEQTIEFFYEALDPHGDWIEVERYGYCWRPAAARDSRWRPYLDGHWAWTEYGWTWISSEPFGWATYHYGRWTRLKRLGWVWVPGSEWAPAWVAWRRSEQHVGWAPLPPDAHSGSGFTAAVDSYYDIGPGSYAFVDVQDFGEPTYVGRVVEPEQNVTIINKTVNVTNITYRNVENKTVVFNGGPEINVINERSEKPVRRVRVERVNDVTTGGTMDAKNNVLRLAAPQIISAAKMSKPPRKLSDRAKAEELDHGWQEADEPTRQKVRAQQMAEAKQAEEAQRNPHTRRADRDEAQARRSREDRRSPEAVAPKEDAIPSPRPAASTPAAAPAERRGSDHETKKPVLADEQRAARAATADTKEARGDAPAERPVTETSGSPDPASDVRTPAEQRQESPQDTNTGARRRDRTPEPEPGAPAATPKAKSDRAAATPPPASAPVTAPTDASQAPRATPLPATPPVTAPAATPVATGRSATKRDRANRASTEEIDASATAGATPVPPIPSADVPTATPAATPSPASRAADGERRANRKKESGHDKPARENAEATAN